jgi:phospholipid/cholesterol/gamma-HCH transport system permease protein
MNPALFNPVATMQRLGSFVIDTTAQWGRSWIFLYRTVVALLRPPYRPYLYLAQLHQIGANSLLVIALIGLFTGAVLAVQGEYTLSKFGANAYTGPAVALSLIRELGPVLTALMVIGRAGSAVTAEIGIMRITEQIDALRSMAVDPIKYLMAPRFLAGIIAMPLLCGIFNVVGILGGYLVAVGLLGLSAGTFMTQITAAVGFVDVYSGFIKATVFGLIFGWVSCYKGYTCGFGAQGVNKATTQSVVTASVAVLIVDYFLTSVLTRLFME